MTANIPLPRARILGAHSAVGRTADAVACACGHVNRFYRWSWAGHGKARCAGCRAWVMYATLEIRTDDPGTG